MGRALVYGAAKDWGMRMPDSADSHKRESIQNEVSRIHESAVYSAQGQFEAAKAWRTIHWSLGSLTAGLSTLAAVLTFATDSQVSSGVLAALAATVLTTSRPDKLAELAVARGNDYTALRNDARRLLHIQVPSDPIAILCEALNGLAARASDLDHISDPIPRFAYKKAKRNVERDGGQQFRADAA